MGSLEDLRLILEKRDSKVKELEELLKSRESEITKLKSQLDKYQSVFPFHTNKTKFNLRRKERNQGISAEPQTFKTIQELFDVSQQKFPVFEKTASCKALVSRAILENDFLKHLDNDRIEEIVECMYPVQYQAGADVIREGDSGSVMFVLEAGEMEVRKDGRVLGCLGAGKLFGELAVLYDCQRTASIHAVTACTLFAIERQCFQVIMMRTGLRRQAEYTAFLRRVSAFEKLPEDVIIKLTNIIEEKTYMEGDYLIRQGAPGDTFYIICRGKVRVTKAGDDDATENTHVEVLGSGDYFGEDALKGGLVRSVSAVALSDDSDSDTCVTCLLIDFDSYRQLIVSSDSGSGGTSAPSVTSPASPAPRATDTSLTTPLLIPGSLTDVTSSTGATFQHKWQLQYDSVQLCDLHVVSTLGVGGFSRVHLVHLGNTLNRSFALKQMKKAQIVETRQQVHILSEKRIMSQVDCAFIVRLYKTFRDAKYLYMLMEPCLGGELWTVLRDRVSFDDTTTRFYTGCVVEAFDYLHSRAIIYRDLKPENLLLDSRGYVKLVDFGFAKILMTNRKTWTFCGTPEYVAPEVILSRGHDVSADYWSLGVLMFELLTGAPPFSALDPMTIYSMILRGIESVQFPRSIARSAAALIRKLCRENPCERIGYQYGGVGAIRKHTWFDGFNWEGLVKRTLTAPIVPHIRSALDSSNFDNYPLDTEPPPPDDLTGWDVDF